MDEESRLWSRARVGDREARDALVGRHMPLARAVAARFGDGGPGREDLAQAAALGLVQAVNAFDPTEGVAFSTFAVPRILGEVRDALRRAGPFAGSRSLARRAGRLRVVQAFLRSALGREPDAGELARALGWGRVELAEVVAALEPMAGVDPLMRTGSEPHAASPEVSVVERLALASALADLPESERRLIALRYWGHLTQSEAASVVGLGQSQVSRRERVALRRLWHTLAEDRPIHTGSGREAT